MDQVKTHVENFLGGGNILDQVQGAENQTPAICWFQRIGHPLACVAAEFKKTTPKSWAITAGMLCICSKAPPAHTLVLCSDLAGAGAAVQLGDPRQGGGHRHVHGHPVRRRAQRHRLARPASRSFLTHAVSAVAVRVKSKENQYPWSVVLLSAWGALFRFSSGTGVFRRRS